MVPPNEVSTCRLKGPKGEWIDKTYGFVIACNCLRRKISQMEVVEDFESGPHKAVSFVMEGEKELQEWFEQALPGRNTKEAGGEEGEKMRRGKEISGLKLRKKWWWRASRRRQEGMKITS